MSHTSVQTNLNQTCRKQQTVSSNPASGDLLGRSTLHDPADVQNMIRAGRSAQQEWVQLPVSMRIKMIRRIGQYIQKNAGQIAMIISEDNGKTIMDALTSEIFPSLIAVDYYCKHTKKYLYPKKISASTIFFLFKRSKIIRVPWGVIGIISPWNYPFSIPFFEVIMGLLAGNAVILKTATETQMVGEALDRCFQAAGLPHGLFHHLNMPGRLVGDALLENGINKLFFTGSVEVGKKLMAKAAAFLIPVSLELGGNDAMIVCEDANLSRAVNGVLWAGFQNCGQSCGGIERIYVHEKIYEPFLKLLKKGVESLRIGRGTDPDTDLGVMTTTEQIAEVATQIKDAVEKGAVIYAESKPPADDALKNCIPAVVLTNVDHSMTVMKEETFGPLVAVMSYSSIEDAIRLANDSTLGLTGSVWSADRRKAEKIGIQMQAGVITINDHLMSHGMPETPWGGFKNSGIGRCHGEIGFEEMTQPQVIVQDLLHFASKNPWWHPYSHKIYQGIEGAIDLLFSRRSYERIAGLWKFLKIVPRMFSTKS
jgi:succinate-semialdehyde dehydrogenase/glutarate-semialdehyde dehydrogenase